MSNRRRISKNPRFYLISVPVTVISVVVILVFIYGLGLNTYLRPSSLTGYIHDKSGNPVGNAAICINDNCSITAENGYYVLLKLTSGLNQLLLTSSEHENLVQTISLKPGENQLNMSVTTAELGNAIIKFTASSAIDNNNLRVEFDNKPVTLGEDNTLRLDSIKAGQYKLLVQSDYFVDQELFLVFERGMDNEREIALETAADVTFAVVDWLTEQPIPNAVIQTRSGKTYQSNELGLIEVTDIGVESAEISVLKENYLPHETVLRDLQPGSNNKLDISLVQTGKIVYIKQTVIGNQIFSNNFAGTEETQLTVAGENSNPWLDEETNIVYFLRSDRDHKNRPEVYSISITGENLHKLSKADPEPAGSFDLTNYTADLRIYEKAEDKSIHAEKISGEQNRTLLDPTEYVLTNPVLSADGKQFFFNYNSAATEDRKNGIYSLSPSLSLKAQIFSHADSPGSLLAVSDNKQLLAFGKDSDIYTFNTTTRIFTRKTETAFAKSMVAFQPSGKNFAFLAETDSGKNLYYSDSAMDQPILLSGSVTDIGAYNWLSNRTISFTGAGDLYVVSLTNPENVRLVTKL